MASCLLRKWGQCRVSATFGGRAPFPSRLGCRALLAYVVPSISRFVRLSRETRDSRAPSLKSRDEGIHAPRGQGRAGTCVPPSGSATPAVSDGTGDRPRTSSSSRTTGRVWTTRTGQRRCRDVPPKVLIFVRLPGQRRREPRTLQTSRVTRGRLSRDLPRKDQFGFLSGANVNPMIFRPRRVEGCEVGGNACT